MQEETRKTSHISYKEYQKKVAKNPNEGIIIFVSAFFMLLLLFLGIAKQISPDVDVSIGDENSLNSDSMGIEKVGIDDRLKLLQMEDNAKEESKEEEMFASELDEKVVIPEQKTSKEKEEEAITLPDKEAAPKPQETASPAPKISQVKVVVGYYNTKEQAEVAKGIIAEAGLNVSPFVRSIGGAYTIQVGSYSTREKAQTVVNDLLRNNYPARIISE